MKLTIAAVVLFCCGLGGSTESVAQCFGGRCGPSFPVAVSSGASQVVVSASAPSLRVRQGLFGRTIIRQTRSRPSVQVVSAAPQVQFVNSGFTTLSTFAAVPAPILNVAGYGYSYGGGLDYRAHGDPSDSLSAFVDELEQLDPVLDRLQATALAIRNGNGNGNGQ